MTDQPFEDTITTAPSPASTGTTISVTTPTMWEIGDRAEVEDQAEVFLIAAGTTNPFTIARAQDGTTAVSITTSMRLLKNPRFTQDQIDKAITRVIAEDLWPEVWVFTTTSITPSTTSFIYDVPSDYEGFVSLVQVASGSNEDLRYIYGAEDFNIPTAVATSLKALRISAWHRMDANATLTYRARPTITNIASTDLEPIVAVGAAARLLRNEAAQKADRIDELDRTRSILRASRLLKEDFEDSLGRYHAQLSARAGNVQRFVRRRVVSG